MILEEEIENEDIQKYIALGLWTKIRQIIAVTATRQNDSHRAP